MWQLRQVEVDGAYPNDVLVDGVACGPSLDRIRHFCDVVDAEDEQGGIYVCVRRA